MLIAPHARSTVSVTLQMNNEVYNEPIPTLFNVTEPDKGASSAHYAVINPLCAEGS